MPTWDATQQRVLDAADGLLSQRGVRGLTVAELARRSGLSRPTIYRSWNDADDVVRSALLRRIVSILADLTPPPPGRAGVVDDILRFIGRFRSDAVFARLLEDEPEVFTRYTLQRVGASQRMILAWLTDAVSAAQHDGSARRGDARQISVMLLMIAQSAVLSHGTVADLIDEDAWHSELRAALDGHLRP